MPSQQFKWTQGASATSPRDEAYGPLSVAIGSTAWSNVNAVLPGISVAQPMPLIAVSLALLYVF